MTIWVGSPPEICDICRKAILLQFVDGKTNRGPWANMCVSCHAAHGVGLGTGRGQLYTYDKALDAWVKAGG